MRARAEMKAVAKQGFARCSRVFLMAGALMVIAGLIAGLPTNLAPVPPTTNVQQSNVLNEAVNLLTKGSAVTPQETRRLTNDYLALNGGLQNVINTGYLTALSLLLTLGVSVLQVGLSHLALIVSAGGEPKITQIFEPFKSFGRWLGLFIMIFIRVLLWSCLFIIPGIVAAYRYRQAVYLMLEDPGLGINKALKRSGELMRGYKLRLFVLDISFFFWLVLEVITFALADLFVTPYRELTYVQFYRDLRGASAGASAAL